MARQGKPNTDRAPAIVGICDVDGTGATGFSWPLGWLAWWQIRRDEAGAIVIPFALIAFVLLLSIAAAVDLSRWLGAKTNVRAAVEAAVLAGARSLQINRGSEAEALAVATSFYRRNRHEIVGLDDQVTFRVEPSLSSVVTGGNAYLETQFLSFIGIPRLPVFALSGAEYAEAVVAAGAHGQTDIEVALMLDVTGSMLGERLESLKRAAKDLVDIVVWEQQSAHSARIALVPFADAVRLDDPVLAAAVMQPAPSRIGFTDRSGARRSWWRDPACATERTGEAAFTDDEPVAPALLGSYFDEDGACGPLRSAVVPLSSDRERLHRAIDELTTGGETAGHLGVAWSWYLLSPRWSMQLPPASRPASYDLLRSRASTGEPRLRKVAVLTSDSDFNVAYCNGISDHRIDCDAPNGTSSDQARRLCENMSAADITIYAVAVGSGASSSESAVLRECASRPSMFYAAADGEALRQAFRDIAVKISRVYLTH